MSIKLQGVIPPVPTIFDAQESFDAGGMGRLIDRLLASEVNGFLFLGSAGEFATLPHEQRKAIAEFRKLDSKKFLTLKEQQKYHRLRHRLGGLTW